MPLLVLVLAVVGLGARAVGVYAFGPDRTLSAAPPNGAAAPVPSADPSARVPAQAQTKPSEKPEVDTRDGGSEPATLEVAENGPGDFDSVSADRDASRERGRLLRYDVRMEEGLPFDGAAVSRKIQRVLSDSRSWTGSGTVRFAQVRSSGDADFTVYLATPDTTDALCAPLLTRGEVSCQIGNRVVLNAKRWAFGAQAYGDDVATYQIYLVNHEVGHRLGRGHVGCARSGAQADVMMQQTKGLDGCRANPWPEPDRD